jgi:hypothetical protein
MLRGSQQRQSISVAGSQLVPQQVDKNEIFGERCGDVAGLWVPWLGLRQEGEFSQIGRNSTSVIKDKIEAVVVARCEVYKEEGKG